MALPTLTGPARITSFNDDAMPFPGEEVPRTETVYGFRVTGLQNHYRSPGLGVPMIGLRHKVAREDWQPEDQFLLTDVEQAFPATGLIELQGSVCGSEVAAGLEAHAEVYDPNILCLILS